MERIAHGIALLALVLNACGGVARATNQDPATSGAPSIGAGASSGQSAGVASSAGGALDSSPGGGTSAGTTSVATAGASNTSSDAGSASSPPRMHDALPCENPTPRAHGGGYVACSDGSLRRATAAACDEALPRATPDLPLAFNECTSDSDCTAAAHGYCAYGACKYGCVTDAECPSDQACFCGEALGTCIPASCRSDADCAAGFPCTAFQAPGFAKPDALACQSPQDECLTDAQCHSLNPRITCKFQVDHRICFRDPIG